MYDVLVPELRDDPLGRGYSAMTDEEVADSLQAVDRPPLLAPLWQIEAYLLANGKWKAISQGTSDAAIAASRYVQSTRVDNLDIDDTGAQMVLSSLVTEGLLTAADKTAIEALAVATQSRAAELGIPEVQVGNVTSARAMIGGAL
jgi:hypothetical protein